MGFLFRVQSFFFPKGAFWLPHKPCAEFFCSLISSRLQQTKGSFTGAGLTHAGSCIRMQVTWLCPDSEIRGFRLNYDFSIGVCQGCNSNGDHYSTSLATLKTLPFRKLTWKPKGPYKYYSSFLNWAVWVSMLV